MSAQATSLRFGDGDFLVSVVALPGTQHPGTANGVRAKDVDALEAAEASIRVVAASARRTIDRLKESGDCPEALDIAVGLAFTAEGLPVIAGGEVQPSISVTLRYDTAR